MEFKFRKNARCLRFENWQDFIEIQRNSPKTADTVVIFLTFNLSDDAVCLLRYLKTQKTNFDILVIDNASESSHWKKLEAEVEGASNISILRTTENIGGAGGYACGLEWVYARDYQYCLVTEDDARPQEVDLVDAMINEKNIQSVITVRFQNNNTTSFAFHFSLYPVHFLMAAGVPDARYFMRIDDQEFSYRLRDAVISTKTTYKCLENYHYEHPVMKRSRKVWDVYFSVRNSLHTEARHGEFKSWIREFFVRVPAGWSKVLADGDFSILRSVMSGLVDYCFRSNSFKRNRKRFKELTAMTPIFPANIEEYDLKLSNLNFTESTKVASSGLSRFLSLSHLKRVNWKDLLFPRPLHLVGSSYLNALHPLWLVSTEVVFVEEFDGKADSAHLMKWKNEISWARVRFAAAMGLSVLTATLLLPFGLARRMITRIQWKRNASAF